MKRFRPWMAVAVPSRIGLRIFAFNLLVLFLPVAGFLYLDVYERELLATQERGMVQQARLVAMALAGERDLAADSAQLLGRLAPQTEARVRVFGPNGVVIADTATLGPAPVELSEPSSADAVDGRSPGLYRVGAWIAQQARAVVDRGRALVRRADPAEEGPALDPPPEVRAALEGRYGAATRLTPGQRSVTLHSALAIRDGDRITGAVLVSQSTWRILQTLYATRLRIFQVVVASVVLAALLSALMAATVVRPLARLRRAATAVARRRDALPGTFRGAERRDEIGDLARALEELTRRLDLHVRQVEGVAADVSHELKNPLTSIRTAAEMIAVADDPGERQRFLDMLTLDVDRLERLVAGVQEMARIDAQLSQEAAPSADLLAVLRGVVDGAALTPGSPVVLRVDAPAGAAHVQGSADRLAQVFDNIVRNARSFSPPDSPVDLNVRCEAAVWRVTVCDRGPGIPPEHLERVFHRFFSFRPAQPGRDHAGLGLPIARAIIEGYGGSIEARNREGGGACFEIWLLRAGAAQAGRQVSGS